VQALDGGVLVALVAENDEAKAAGAPSHLVDHHNGLGRVELGECCTGGAHTSQFRQQKGKRASWRCGWRSLRLSLQHGRAAQLKSAIMLPVN
jgi:hypothetical protein